MKESDVYPSYREIDLPNRSLLTLPQLVDHREIERLAARRSVPCREGKPGRVRPAIRGEWSGGPKEGGTAYADRPRGRRSVLDLRAVARMGLAVVIVAGILVLFLMPKVGADRGPVPSVSHVVKPGDTLWAVAEAHTPPTGDVRATVDLIRSINGGTSMLLMVGDVIEVPVGDIPGAVSG